MAVPLFGPIMIFKITHFEFSFPLFYYFLNFFLAIKPKKIEQEMSLKKTNGVGLKKEENITQG